MDQKITKSTDVQSRPDVFSYQDFRKYLEAYYTFKKAINPKYSYQVFARRADVCISYLRMVIAGQRNIPASKVKKIASACELKSWEANYFSALVRWNQESDATLKETYLADLLRVAPKENIQSIQKIQEDTLSAWYTLALLQMVELKDFKLDYSWIARRFSNLVTAAQVEATFSVLRNLGIIEVNEGRVILKQRALMASTKELSAELIKAYHKKNIPQGVIAIDRVPRELREIGSVCFSVPQNHIEPIRQKIEAFRDELLEYVASLENSDEVYQYNFQLFPLTKKVEGGS